MILKNDELIKVSGGAISGTMLNALSRGLSTLLDLGRSLGTAIRMIITGKRC